MDSSDDDDDADEDDEGEAHRIDSSSSAACRSRVTLTHPHAPNCCSRLHCYQGGGEAVDSSSTDRTPAASSAAAGDSLADKGKKPAVKVKKVKLALASTMPVFGPTKKLPTTILMQSDVSPSACRVVLSTTTRRMRRVP